MRSFALLAACTSTAPDTDTDTVAPIDTETSPQETCETVWQTDANRVVLDVPSGLEWCWDVDQRRGAARRVADVPRVVDLHDGNYCSTPVEGIGCASNADCGGDVCMTDRFMECGCVHVCKSDGDCSAGTICVPSGVSIELDGTATASIVNTCRPATCLSSSDCDGGACRLALGLCSYASEQAVCAQPTDTCRFESDCEDNKVCRLEYGVFACVDNQWCE